MKTLNTIITVTFLLLACEEQDVTLENAHPGQQDLQPTSEMMNSKNSGIENAPSQSGLIVTRNDQFIFYIYTDERSGLTAVHSVDIVGFCAGDFDFLDLVFTQLIEIPNHPNRLVILQKGEMLTQVYKGLYDFMEPFCDFFTTANLLAQGTTEVVATDNDLIVYQRENKNRNAAGIRARGELTSPEGETLIFDGISRLLWDGQGDGTDFSVIEFHNRVWLK